MLYTNEDDDDDDITKTFIYEWDILKKREFEPLIYYSYSLFTENTNPPLFSRV
jgi:hypothetical protein